MAKDTDIRKAFVDQAAHCKDLGSPFMARLCTLFSERLVLTDPVGQVLSNWSGDVSVSGDVLPLRLAGALHALVLEHRCEALATVYPPHHNDLDDDTLWQAVNGALITDADFIVDWLDSPPQTNEVRRSGVLLPGFLAIADLVEKPLVLSEIGASAGLNLFWDRFHYGLGDVTWGEENPALHLEPQWEGEAVAPRPIEVLSRAGCDLIPLDATNPEDRLRLKSYVWADQAERMALLSAALDVAAQQQIAIEKADALDWLRNRLAPKYDGAVHVIFHSIVWQYMSPEDRAAGAALIADAGAKATGEAPLAWLRLEADGKAPGGALTLTLWPSGEEQCLGRADFHGRWINWRGWQA